MVLTWCGLGHAGSRLLPAGPDRPGSQWVEEWRVGLLGGQLRNVRLADLDGDGSPELIGLASAGGYGGVYQWWVVSRDPAGDGYRIRWVSDPTPADIGDVITVDVTGTIAPEILVGLCTGTILVFDGSSMRQLASVQTPAWSVNRMVLGDADNDGETELVICDDDATYLLSVPGLELDGQLPYGGSDVEVGNVDDDPDQEVVLSVGRVLEYDGSGTTVEWTNPGGEFGYIVDLADIDQDSKAEIVGASNWYYVTAFDADLHSQKWQIEANLDISSLLLYDVTGDGVAETIYGDLQAGAIHCHDSVTLTELWALPNPYPGVWGLAIGDTDMSPGLEAVWGASSHHLVVADLSTQTVEWEGFSATGPFLSVEAADTDGDGSTEIVVATMGSDGGYSDGIVFVYDATTHELEWQTSYVTLNNEANEGLNDLWVANIDSDPTPEILVAAEQSAGGAVLVLDGSSPTLESVRAYDRGTVLRLIAVADVDSDGELEVVAGAQQTTTGAPGVFVYVSDAVTGATEWRSDQVGTDWSAVNQLAVANVDGDPALEIVAVNDWLYVFDGITHAQWQSPDSDHLSIDVFDVDGDGRDDILAGTYDGRVVAIDGQTHAEILQISVGTDLVAGVRAYRTCTGEIEVVVVSQGRVSVLDIANGSLLWQSQFLGDSAGRNNALAVGDVDSDGYLEVIVGSNNIVCQFQGPDLLGRLFADGFESGDVSSWSTGLWRWRGR